MDYRTILALVLPVYGVIVVGAAARRAQMLVPHAQDALMRLVINVLFPCLVFEKILGNAALQESRNVVIPPLLGFATVCLGYLVAGLLGRALREPVSRRTFAFTAGTYNYGYIPIPLALALFGDATVGVLFVFNIGVEFALWTVGVVTLTGSVTTVGWRAVLSAPLIAIVASLLLNAVGAREHFPTFLLSMMATLGQCAIPLALLLIGAVAHDHASEAQGSRVSVPVLAVVVRLGVLPLMFLGMAHALPLTEELDHVIILQAAMPAAMFPVVMTRLHGGDVGTALRVVITTSLVSLFTAPLWIREGIRLLD